MIGIIVIHYSHIFCLTCWSILYIISHKNLFGCSQNTIKTRCFLYIYFQEIMKIEQKRLWFWVQLSFSYTYVGSQNQPFKKILLVSFLNIFYCFQRNKGRKIHVTTNATQIIEVATSYFPFLLLMIYIRKELENALTIEINPPLYSKG